MIFMEYKTRFHDLSKHAIDILQIVYERKQCFVQGLRLPLRMASQILVTTKGVLLRSLIMLKP